VQNSPRVSARVYEPPKIIEPKIEKDVDYSMLEKDFREKL
jgi:hypothetical protein